MRGGACVANIQISDIKMPTLREVSVANNTKVEMSFRFTLLSQIGESELQEKLTQMVEDITKQGQRIAEHMDIRDLKVYRSMISNFLGEVVANSHQFSRENFLDRRGRHRVYGIIRQVNDKLDELARELIKSEKNQVDILDRIGEIQGLVLDVAT